MRLFYNWSFSTHPNPSLKKGGAPLRCKIRAHSHSLFQGGGQGVGTLNAYARIAYWLIGWGQNENILSVSTRHFSLRDTQLWDSYITGL